MKFLYIPKPNKNSIKHYFHSDEIQTAITITNTNFALTHKALAEPVDGGIATLQRLVVQYTQLVLCAAQYIPSSRLISEAHFLSNTPLLLMETHWSSTLPQYRGVALVVVVLVNWQLSPEQYRQRRRFAGKLVTELQAPAADTLHIEHVDTLFRQSLISRLDKTHARRVVLPFY